MTDHGNAVERRQAALIICSNNSIQDVDNSFCRELRADAAWHETSICRDAEKHKKVTKHTNINPVMPNCLRQPPDL